MEDDETFDAGRGSFLNRDGKVQLDAFIMDGATLRGGGVGCVERIANPIRAARKILGDSHMCTSWLRARRGSPRSMASRCVAMKTSSFRARSSVCGNFRRGGGR